MAGMGKPQRSRQPADSRTDDDHLLTGLWHGPSCKE
jgi:hypothetical protein